MARLEESLHLCLERHDYRMNLSADDLIDPAVMRADTLDLARMVRILGQLEELTKECVGEEYTKQVLDKLTAEQRFDPMGPWQ